MTRGWAWMSVVALGWALTMASPAWTQDSARSGQEGRPAPVSFPWQDQWWEGLNISEIRPHGFVLHSLQDLQATVLELHEHMNLTAENRDQAIRNLLRTRYFDHRSIRIEPVRDPANEHNVIVEISVEELPVVDEVVIHGASEIDESDLRSGLRISRAGDTVDPYLQTMDLRFLEKTYRDKGFHHVQVEASTEPVGEGRVRLIWTISEGPEVEVADIQFHGNTGIDDETLLNAMGTHVSKWFSSATFVQRRLELDIMRLRLLYAQHGYLDMPRGENIFARELEFSPDRSEVTIHIQVVETPLYRVGEIVVDGNQVIPTEEILAKIRLQPGDACNEITTGEDAAEIRNLYAERSYILAQVNPGWEPMPGGEHLMRLRIGIQEREPAVVGLVEIEGHRLTRDDVIRRELRAFAPGEPFDGVELDRGIQRLYDTGWFEPGSITYWHEESQVQPGALDVHIKVQEKKTGSFRLLGGFSSSFGLVGVLEFTQSNFDIADVPRGVDDILRGEAFVGGGQYFNIRFMPGQRRQQFSVGFREPYIFGLDYGGGFRFSDTITNRESWNETLLGGGIFFDRRWGDLRVALNLDAKELTVDNVDADAPATVQSLDGSNLTIQIGPSVRYDRRDSAQLATSGYLVDADVNFSTEAWGSDFNFWKTELHGEYLIPVIESADRNRMRRHVLTLSGTLGVGDGMAGDETIPFFDRFFAGGRGSMRGFAFRGMGPHESDDPVGGQMLVVGTVEYSFPIYEDFLRLAVFYDVGNLASEIDNLGEDAWRHTLGVGVRALIPFLSQAPIALDFGFALEEEDFDDSQIITFDVGKLF